MRNFDQHLSAGMRENISRQGLSVREAVILASIIQREAVELGGGTADRVGFPEPPSGRHAPGCRPHRPICAGIQCCATDLVDQPAESGGLEGRLTVQHLPEWRSCHQLRLAIPVRRRCRLSPNRPFQATTTSMLAATAAATICFPGTSRSIWPTCANKRLPPSIIGVHGVDVVACDRLFTAETEHVQERAAQCSLVFGVAPTPGA